jgi:hypothetical protein
MNDNEAIGALVIKYRDNERKLGTLRASLDTIRSEVASLNQMIQQPEPNIEVTARDFRAGFGNSVVSRNLLESLATTLEDLSKALDKERHLEVCLRQQNLEMFIWATPRDSKKA